MHQKALRNLSIVAAVLCAGSALLVAKSASGVQENANRAAAALRGTTRVSGRPQANVVVWLDGGVPADKAGGVQTDKAGSVPTKKVVLDQRNLNFYPSVLVVRVGTTVELPNHDRVFHNVFSFHNGKRFDLGLYPVGTVRSVVFDQPGLSRIFCNIHPNMAAYVMAVESPYFTISDEHGEFEIAHIPPGRYAYHAWRSGGPQLNGSSDVGGGHTLEISWP